jgi:membrane-associated phospholipid phosphatase
LSLRALLYDWGGLNVWLFHAINQASSAWSDHLWLLGTALGDHDNFFWFLGFFGLATALVGWKGGKRRAFPWLYATLVFVLGYVAEDLLVGGLKGFFDFPRPLLALPPETIHLLGPAKLHNSLPSGHAAFAALFAASIWPALKRPGRVAAALFVVWVGFSRIGVGAHFPADVFYGTLLSVLLAWALRRPVKAMLNLACAKSGWEIK